MGKNGITKLYYSISEVANMMEVEPHVLRYWESEFPILAPRKNRAGRRIYRKSDIKTLQKIHFLLKDRRYTIEGARQVLANGGTEDTAEVSRAELEEIRTFLAQMLETL
jgi:DNA-binding transcriptional MerR regulator